MDKFADIVRFLFPFPLLESARNYVKRYSEAAQFKEAFQNLEAEAQRSKTDQQKHFLTHAQRYMAEEDARGASIIARAQALLIAQTFFGALLAFGTAIMGRGDMFVGWRLVVLCGLLAYIVSLVLLLTLNALRATQGLEYQRIGTSDLTACVSKPERTLVKALALLTLANYRHAAIVNTWRMTHLHHAQKCLSRIVFALAGLISFVFLLMVLHKAVSLYE